MNLKVVLGTLMLMPGLAQAQTALTNGTPVTISDSINQIQSFSLVVPQNITSLSFTTTGGTGDPDISVYFDTEVLPRCTSLNGGTGSTEEFCEIANPEPGTWFVDVEANFAYANVELVGLAAVGLADEVARTISGGTGSENWYYIDVPVGQTRLTVTTSGGTGNPNLLVGDDLFGNPQCQSGNAGTADECALSSIASGRWFVLVAGSAAYASVSLVADHSIATGRSPSSGAFGPGAFGVLLLAGFAALARRRLRGR